MRLAVAASAPLVPFAIHHWLRIDHLGLVYVAAALAATALSPEGGIVAAAIATVFFGLREDLADTLVMMAVAFPVPIMAIRLRGEHARLRASEFRARALVEQLPVGIYIDEPDAGATNLYSNPEIVRMLGHSAEQWGEPGFFSSLLHPEDRNDVVRRLGAAVDEGGAFDDSYRLRAADGSYRWMVDRGVLVHDEHGRRLHVQGVLLDVTAAKEAEQAAEAIRRRYRSLIEELPLVTYVEDARDPGRTIYISPQVEELLGYPVERWLEDTDFFFQVLDPAFHASVRDARDAGETDAAHEYRLLAADGSARWIDSRRTLVRGDDGEPLYVQGLWVDVTERRELEERLRRQDRLDAVGQLAAGVAHNFNNMLLAIRGYAELAATRHSVADARDDIAVIRETSDRSAELVRQLLEFSRRQEIAPRPTDLRVVLGELRDLLRQLVGAHIDIVFIAPEHPVVANVDRARIEQAVVNLAVNARDAMTLGGTLTIALDERAGEDADWVVVTVSDTGIGIPPDLLERVFDPFFTTKSHGSGLGLASVHGTISQSGGDVRIVRSEPGAGTAFEILLPAARSRELRPAAALGATA